MREKLKGKTAQSDSQTCSLNSRLTAKDKNSLKISTSMILTSQMSMNLEKLVRLFLLSSYDVVLAILINLKLKDII